MVLRATLQWRAVSARCARHPAAGSALLLAAVGTALPLPLIALLLPVAIPAFAVVELVEPRPRRTDARRHAAFEAAMAAALADQEAEQSQRGARPR